MKQIIRSHVVGHIDFVLPIQIEIEHGDPQPFPFRDRDTNLVAHFAEAPVAEIQERSIDDRFIVSRPAVTGNAIELAMLLVFQSDIQVSHDVQIEMPIVVEIQPDAARAPFVDPSARLDGHVVKGAVAEIAQQRAGPITGNIQVFKTIGIEIANGAALSVTHRACECRCRNLFEVLAVSIAIQRVRVLLRPMRLGREFVAVDQKQVEPAVSIEVEPSCSATHDLRQKITTGNSIGMKPEAQTKGRGNILESRSRAET